MINCLSALSQQTPEAEFFQSQQAPAPPPGIMAGQPDGYAIEAENGLLFHLSGREGFNAIYAAGGQTRPNYLKNVRITENGPFWHAIETDDAPLMSYWAPGNIYAQRGTLSFFWRLRCPSGSPKFPIFHVKYTDHSSRDMDWLRIDYNGYGFDAFVTDNGLSRTRLSHYVEEPPEPDEWIHISLSWDETEGLSFYVNGILVEKTSVNGMVYDTGLDQFGLFPVTYNMCRMQSRDSIKPGGDLADLRIYDRMLSDEDIFTLARGERVIGIPHFSRNMTDRRWRDAWWNRHGWNLPNEAPPLLTSPGTMVHKVGIFDVTDMNQLYWKANDGIRETTWPEIFRLSGLPGRYDNLLMADRDSYFASGRTLRIGIPENETWNHVEIWGNARGHLTFESEHSYVQTFGMTNKNQVKSYHRLREGKKGGTVRFDNILVKEPIGSIMIYNVIKGKAPVGIYEETFNLVPFPASGSTGDEAMDRVAAFVCGRYPADERTLMKGITEGETAPDEKVITTPYSSKPFIHIIIPYTHMQDKGLDGIEIHLPEMEVNPTHKGVYPMNLRIKDPLWQIRDMADFSFSVEPGKEYSLWIDTRDRILPEGRALYITLAGAGGGLDSELLTKAKIKLVYKSKEEALEEHIKDRLTQIKDLHTNLMEKNMLSSRFNRYNRFYADIMDLLIHDPDNRLARAYRYYVSTEQSERPEYEITEAPEGVPEWAHLQVEYLRHLERLTTYYISKKQISNGEFGGGPLSDGVLTDMMTVAALAGIYPDEILESLSLHMSSGCDRNLDHTTLQLRERSLPIFRNGLSTNQANEHDACPEGIRSVRQLMLADRGNPLHINRLMEFSRRLISKITEIKPDDYGSFISGCFGGTNTSKEAPWQWSVPLSYNLLNPLYLIARYNGNPEIRQIIIDMADAFLVYADDNNPDTRIHLNSGKAEKSEIIKELGHLFQAAFNFTGDSVYYNNIQENYQKSREFNPGNLSGLYRENIKEMGVREYINTEGGIHQGRAILNQDFIQQDRLGGIAIKQNKPAYPDSFIRWNIIKPGNFESLAVFIPKAGENSIKIISYNLENETVSAFITPGQIIPGIWRLKQGVDTSNNQEIDRKYSEQIINLSRGEKLELAFEPREHTIINLQLVEPYSKTYWERADLGIGKDDIKEDNHDLIVRIHSLGAVDAPETTIELRDASGNIAVSERVPSLKAPVDLIPRWTDIRLKVPEGADISRGSVTVDPYQKIPQISRSNTIVKW